MKNIRLVFEKGGTLHGCLDEKAAPETVMAIWSALPCQTVFKHTRWCGREVYGNIATGTVPAKENHTATVSKFDISYWREDWDLTTGQSAEEAAESIACYYGPEYLSYAGGILPLNVIGRIDFSDEPLLDEIGQRIWMEGFEKVTIEKG